jgi:hypothetical protein
MTDRKQSAHARREDRKLQGTTSATDSNTIVNLNTFVEQTTQNLATIGNTLGNVSTQTDSTTILLNQQLDVTNITSWEARIQDLENNPVGGGGGGIDPSDPDQPVIIVDNYIRQPNGDAAGTLSLYLYPYGNTTVLNSFSLPIFFVESEVDHPGIMGFRFPNYSTGPYALALGATVTADICKFLDVNTVYYIIKTPATLFHSIRIGFKDDYGTDITTNGIFFERLMGEANISIVTRSGGTQTKTSSGIAYSANTWYIFKIARTLTNTVDFTINTTTINQTTNIPTGFLNVGIQLLSDGTSNTADEDFKIDFFSLKLGDVAAVLPTGTTVVGTAGEVEVTTVGSVITVGLPSSVLINTTLTSLANNDVLQWNTTEWVNRSLSSAGIAAATHTHVIADITSIPQMRLLGRWNAGGTGVGQHITIGNGLKLSALGELATIANSPVPDTLALTAGLGLTGGGDLSANRTFAVNFVTSGVSNATQVVRADDSRLSNSRTPTSHTHALSDLTQTGATLNQVIQWNNTAWVPATISGGSDFIDGGFPSDNYSNIATIDGGTP